MYRMTGRRLLAKQSTKPMNYLQHLMAEATTSVHPIAQIAEREQAELRNMARHLRLDPRKSEHYVIARDFTNLTTEKSVAFEVIRQMMTRVSTRDQKEFDETARSLYGTLITDGAVEALDADSSQIAEQCQEKAAEILDGVLEGGSSFSEEMRKSPTLKYLEDGIDGKQIPITEESFPVLVDIIADTLAAQENSKRVSKKVSSAIKRAIEEGAIKPMEQHVVGQSTLSIIGGHAGSGKGHLTKKLIETGGLKPENTCRLTPDDYHGSLQIGGDIDLGSNKTEAGELNHELVTPIMKAVEDDLKRGRETTGTSPSVVKEVIVISPERIREAAATGQQVRCCVTVHDDIKAVVDGAHKRFLATGRHVPIDYIYNGQVVVSRLMPEAFDATLRTQSSTVRVELYNTTHIHHQNQTEPTTPVAVCDAQSKKTLVFRLDDFVRFNAKQILTIPTTLDQQQEVNQEILNDQEQVQLFLKNYAEVKKSLIFIDPNIDREQVNHLEKHVYAHFDEDTGVLKIDNPEVYNRIKNESELSKYFFEELEKAPELRVQQQR